MKCLNLQNIDKYVDHTLGKDELKAFEGHLLSCSECSEALNDARNARAAVVTFASRFLEIDDCPDYEALSGFVDGSLEEQFKCDVKAHANSCELCASDIERIIQLRAQADLRGEVNINPGQFAQQSQSFWQSFWFKAGAGVCVAGLLAVAFIGNHNPAQAPRSIAIAPPTVQQAPAEQAEPKSESHSATLQPPSPTIKQTTPAVPTISVQPKPRVAVAHVESVLKDGSIQIIRNNGHLKLVAKAGKASELINAKLRGQSISPKENVQIAMSGVRLRAKAQEYVAPANAPELISPVGITVEELNPVLKWGAVELADSYKVVVTNLSGETVYEAVSSKPSIQVAFGLKRSEQYAWRVAVKYGEQDTWTFSNAAPFRVLSDEDMKMIEQARREYRGSHLAIGAVYESVGLADAARREYAQVKFPDKHSAQAQQLLSVK